jgi:hypothetical protein
MVAVTRAAALAAVGTVGPPSNAGIDVAAVAAVTAVVVAAAVAALVASCVHRLL